MIPQTPHPQLSKELQDILDFLILPSEFELSQTIAMEALDRIVASHSSAPSERDKALDTDTLLQTLKKRYRNEMAIIDYIEMIECEVMALRTPTPEAQR